MAATITNASKDGDGGDDGGRREEDKEYVGDDDVDDADNSGIEKVLLLMFNHERTEVDRNGDAG